MSLVKMIMGAMIATILGVGVAVPVVNQVVANASLSATDQTLVGFISTLIIAAILYSLATIF